MYESGTGDVVANLRIPSGARTGRTSLVLVNGDAAHTQSTSLSFTVVGNDPPVVNGIFPNFAAPGETVLVTVGGSGFSSGAMVVSSDPKLHVDSATVADSHRILATLRLDPDVASGSVTLYVRAVGGSGSSEPSPPFRVLAPGATGPHIDFVRPGTLVGGTSAQARLDGTGLDATAGDLEIVQVASDQIEAPFVGTLTSILPGTVEHAGLAVAELRGTADIDPSLPPPTGLAYFAVRRADGLVTGDAAVQFVPRPQPYVRAAQVGRIARGGTVVETLEGSGLFDVTDVLIEGGGVERVPNVPAVSNTGGTSLTVTLRADADAPLTGDAATNLVVETRRGRSNLLSYRVVVAATGDCSAIPDQGADIRVLYPEGLELAEVGEPSPILPDSDHVVQYGETYMVFGQTAAGYVSIVLPLRPSEIHGTSAPVRLVSYTDDFETTWADSTDSTVQVVEETPQRIKLCIDAVLPGGPTHVPAQVHVKGYVVIVRAGGKR